MLLGREHERRAIERALSAARCGESSTLALTGEPGIGKSALLDHAAARSQGMRVLRAHGIQSEAEIPFGGLLELLRPVLGMLDRIPHPQAEALEAAMALRPGSALDRFAVGAATLSLLACCAEESPVTLLVDDAHWLDGSSAQALLFAVRRLVADPVAVFIAARSGEPGAADLSGLPTIVLRGLSPGEVAELLPRLTQPEAARLHAATAGNPLALLELDAAATENLALYPDGAPVLLPARLGRVFLSRAGGLPPATRRALVLAATSHTDELTMLTRAAGPLAIDLDALLPAEAAELVTLRDGRVVFRHPLVRSAIYANAAPQERRAAHRALADVLPDRDVDLRAWHLAAAAHGLDAAAAGALRDAGVRARDRSAYATASAAFARAARLEPRTGAQVRLRREAAEAAWLAGMIDQAVTLLDDARAIAGGAEGDEGVEISALAGRIAAQRGPADHARATLVAAADRAPPLLAVELLAEAASISFYAARPDAMLAAAEAARGLLPADAPVRPRLLAGAAAGMAHVLGGDASAGARELRSAVALAEAAPQLHDDVRMLPWLAIGPIFLRDAAGRTLLAAALRAARERAAVGALPFVLNLIARDEATTDAWTRAESTYGEAIELARESGQQIQLAFGLSGLAWLQARRGRESECRALAEEALHLARRLQLGLHEVWATAALGELELALGRPSEAAMHFEEQQRLLRERRVTDPDLSPAPELTEAYLRLGRADEAAVVAARYAAVAEAKGQPWCRARAGRCRGLIAGGGDAAAEFEEAVRCHALTPDTFELARTRLVYGERLRRERSRALAREQLRGALQAFARLDARPWLARASTELAATGETHRGRDPSTRDDLTPQELRIALSLADDRTTRETAAELFLSPKTVEYHLRHVYQKLGINSRAQLAEAFAADNGEAPAADTAAPDAPALDAG